MSYSHSDKRSTQNLGHLGESMQEQQHFLFFPALPAEIRLIIWEYTWPEARVIEAAIHVDFSGDEATEWTYLRPAGSLAAFLRTVVFWRDLDTKSPLETCSPPQALGICRESREHTLRHYKFMKHSMFPQHSFYFNSLRDVLWLSLDIASEWEDLEDFREFYDGSLNSFKTLLIQDGTTKACRLSIRDGLFLFYPGLKRSFLSNLIMMRMTNYNHALSRNTKAGPSFTEGVMHNSSHLANIVQPVMFYMWILMV